MMYYHPNISKFYQIILTIMNLCIFYHFLLRHSLLVSALAPKARHEERQSYALAAQLASDGHVEGMAAKAEMCLG